MLETLRRAADFAWKYAEEKVPESIKKLGIAGQALGTVITVVVAAVAIIVGIFIFANIHEAMPAMESGSAAENAIENVTDITYDVFGLLPIILIVLVAAAIIAVLYRLAAGK